MGLRVMDRPHALSALLACLLFAGCSEPPRRDDHTHVRANHALGQQIVACDDDSRADIAFLDNGLRMAVTWLPRRGTEWLIAPRTGAAFQGARTRATIAGGTIAFQRDTGFLRLCHRID
ncbi:hypothetical protein SAQ01S_12260 [Sphingomonas aquatilis NBRC 16722]|jgi:hypothetical protein|nr:hypothetical protein SAQ01S_12260 [Sphingomonas aquatilis NBRC 16722]